MPNRPRGKNVGWDGKPTRKDPRSCRSRNAGVETADGRFQSEHDLKCLEAQGAQLDKVFPDLVNS